MKNFQSVGHSKINNNFSEPELVFYRQEIIKMFKKEILKFTLSFWKKKTGRRLKAVAADDSDAPAQHHATKALDALDAILASRDRVFIRSQTQQRRRRRTTKLRNSTRGTRATAVSLELVFDGSIFKKRPVFFQPRPLSSTGRVARAREERARPPPHVQRRLALRHTTPLSLAKKPHAHTPPPNPSGWCISLLSSKGPCASLELREKGSTTTSRAPPRHHTWPQRTQPAYIWQRAESIMPFFFYKVFEDPTLRNHGDREIAD